MLFSYMKATQRFLRDSNVTWINPEDLIAYVNQARREVAMKTAAIRRVPPISGQILSVSITNVGSGYTAPTVSVNAPDFPSGYPPAPNGRQAVLDILETGGQILSVNVEDGGAGYFQPQITITDPTGIDAAATAELSPMNLLLAGQELYNFSDVDMSSFPGVGSIYSVRSVSILYSNYRYSLPCYSFSQYQAYIRQYPFQYQYVPTVCCQLGRGVAGSLLFYPLPSQTYQMEWDAYCLPSDLQTDEDFEALPEPWTDAVAYFAAHLAFLELQNANSARMMLDLFDRQVSRYSQATLPGRMTNPYGRV